jgi:hypothetical protein
MESNRLVKDVTKLVVSENKAYGITTPENIQQGALDYFHGDMTYNAEYVLDALLAMKSMNEGSLKDCQMLIPRIPYPLLLNNGLQCYLIAPISEIKGERL